MGQVIKGTLYSCECGYVTLSSDRASKHSKTLKCVHREMTKEETSFVREADYDKKGTEILHPSIGRIKTCALMGCSVDYAPDNTYMTFDDDDRTMTSYQMTLRFSELDPIYESDYSDSTGKATDPYNIGPNEIGF